MTFVAGVDTVVGVVKGDLKVPEPIPTIERHEKPKLNGLLGAGLLGVVVEPPPDGGAELLLFELLLINTSCPKELGVMSIFVLLGAGAGTDIGITGATFGADTREEDGTRAGTKEPKTET